MRIKPDQLAASLQKGLKSVYFLSGDEPLQLGEMADAIRRTARLAGYTNREILTADTGFEWHQLAYTADTLSLFADKKIIDLRLPTGTPGTEGAKALIAYCERLSDDTLLLITAGKIASASLKSKWLETLDKHGVVIQVWPLAGNELQLWLQQRLQQRGLEADNSGLRLLASRIEGNLLAASQEIEKLYVLYGTGKLTLDQITEVVADSSRYDVFKLIDSVLAANANRMVKILSGLRAEGVAEPIVLWALAREARTLSKIKRGLALGQNKEQLFRDQQIWENRKALVNNALTRLSEHDLNQALVLGATADRQIKGQQSGDCWETLFTLCLQLAGLAYPTTIK